MCLRLHLVAVDRALQGVDHMVVRVVLIIVQYTVVGIGFSPEGWRERLTVID